MAEARFHLSQEFRRQRVKTPAESTSRDAVITLLSELLLQDSN